MDQIVAEIRKIPPVTRFVCGSSLAVTLSVLIGAVSPYTVLFTKDYVFKKYLLWRLYTAFFFGGGGINYIFEFIMLYRSINDIESRSYPGRSSDLAWQLIWACAAIVGTTWPLRTFIFTKPFLTCIVYLYSSLAPPGAMTSIMGLVTVPIKYYPYVMIAFDLLMAGPQVAAQSVAGAVVGHAWWWSVWGGELGSQGVLGTYARAPQWMRNLLGETRNTPPPAAGGTAAGLRQAGIHVSAPRQTPQPATSSGHNWGSGRRLGSD